MKVTRETAELAKEKGFNVPCNFYVYTPQDLERVNKSNRGTKFIYEPGHIFTQQNKFLKGRLFDRNKYCTTVSIPTQDALQTWLRDTRKIYVSVLPYNRHLKPYFEVVVDNITYSNFKTWEEALELGLQEGLKMID